MQIAKNHLRHFTTIKEWDRFAKENSLPKAKVYISVFSSWTQVKKELNVTPYQRKKKYSLNQIEEIIKVHKQHLTSKENWDAYAKDQKLPSYLTLIQFYKWEDIKRLANQPIRYNYRKEDLMKIAKQNKFEFTTMNNWNRYAKKYKLPYAATYVRKFGSWRKAKLQCIYRNQTESR
ncbi:hypothetical protein MUN89_18025 [Halobacillus salinarum]|uniref:Uncharacterized protein n=1 Tax=Halobacillus salinarum TaxID=2932257 RepID=A0ABY4EHY6_9BACI|nr:hypothetical protein [Halobacillus salinarum]UOQ43759.1 hypothetical protein MUN89_18025 [Halobacillus salinarum]